MNKSLASGLAIVLIALFGSAALYYMHGRASPSSSASAVGRSDARLAEEVAPGFATTTTAGNTPFSGSLKPPRTPPAGQSEYRSTEYRFSLFYPNDLQTRVYDEGGGASTFVFQNPAESKGFQIFVVPDTDQQVSLSHFRRDEPTGDMQSPLNVTIGGAAATSFYGSDKDIGPTAEIWFLRGGYLFEVTAPKDDAQWLSTIMQTWQFI